MILGTENLFYAGQVLGLINTDQTLSITKVFTPSNAGAYPRNGVTVKHLISYTEYVPTSLVVDIITGLAKVRTLDTAGSLELTCENETVWTIIMSPRSDQ